jgi:hypothetical protein
MGDLLVYLPIEVVSQALFPQCSPVSLLTLATTSKLLRQLALQENTAAALVRSRYPTLHHFPHQPYLTVLREIAVGKLLPVYFEDKCYTLLVSKVHTVAQLYNALLHLPYILARVSTGTILPLSNIMGLASLSGVQPYPTESSVSFIREGEQTAYYVCFLSLFGVDYTALIRRVDGLFNIVVEHYCTLAYSANRVLATIPLLASSHVLSHPANIPGGFYALLQGVYIRRLL